MRSSACFSHGCGSSNCKQCCVVQRPLTWRWSRPTGVPESHCHPHATDAEHRDTRADTCCLGVQEVEEAECGRPATGLKSSGSRGQASGCRVPPPCSGSAPAQTRKGGSGVWKFVGVHLGPRVPRPGGRRGLGRAGQALGGRWARAAAAEGEEPGPDGAGAEDEHDAVGTSLKRVPDSLLGREEGRSARAAGGLQHTGRGAGNPRPCPAPWGRAAMTLHVGRRRQRSGRV